MPFKFNDIAYTLETLPEDPTPKQFIMLNRVSLELVPYTRMKWQCQAKGCKGGTHVRDYGVAPWYFLDRNSKASYNNARRYWRNLNERFYFCSRHWAACQKLLKRGYDKDHIYRRLCDWSKLKVISIKPAGERQ